ncbi:MAG: glycosyl transferase [Muribaculaceae bacterium]|nr:glycosyl transferase [Muribaculaceae bacterium]
MLAPIVIFAFNRPDALRGMIDSLKRNPLYDESEKFVFVDGPRNEAERVKVDEVVAVAREITENVVAADSNRGLGLSIIAGVSDIINRYGRAIVLEDDLVLMPGFLQYMNQALDAYQADERIFAVCGYGLKIKRPAGYVGDVYLCNRASSWGWATWADRWNSVDWNVSDWEQLQADRRMQRAFNRGGSDMYGMLRGYMEGRNKSWAIRFCYSQFRQGRYSVHPFRSLVENDGFGDGATNCRQKYSRFKTCVSDSLEPLVLPEEIEPAESLIKDSANYHSLARRIYSRLRRILDI